MLQLLHIIIKVILKLINKNKIILTIIFSIFFVLSISAYFNTTKQKEYIELKHQQSFEVMQQMLDGKIIFFRKLLSNRLKSLIYQNEKFKDFVTKNNFDKTKTLMNKAFKAFKKENKYIKTLQFVSEENISLYRVDTPNNSGEDLSQIRPIIHYVNAHKRAKYGFEVDNETILYRVVVPIVYQNKHYGLLELGISPDLFIDDLTSVSNYIQSATLIANETYNKMLQRNNSLAKKHKIHFNDYVSFNENSFFNTIHLDKLGVDKHFKLDNEYYTTFLYNLMTFNGEVDAKVLIALNMTADQKRINNIITLSFINQIILIFIIYLIVYFAFKYYDKKITRLTEQERQNERIIHQQSKMAGMGEMIGNIAHQWRQPLSTISTIASGINIQKEYGIFDDSTLHKSMETIVQQTEHMSQTIEDFRDFFKSDKEKTEFKLTHVLKQNISLVKASLKSHNIDLKYIPHNEIKLTGLQNELTQAILNILTNSKDQLINLDLKEKVITIETTDDTENVYIEIIDNGGGISDNIIHKIFDPYFTTKHQSQGTGIGLYMTHEIIVKHFHGTITVKNIETTINDRVYQGALFKISLPKR